MAKFLFLFAAAGLMTSAHAESFLKNSGFDQKLAPWKTDDGKLAPDPTNPKNSALRLEVSTAFGLTQAFTWPADKKQLTLSFKALAETASKKSPIQLRVRLYDKGGNSALMAAHRIESSGKWQEIKLTLDKPDFKPVSFMLESNRGESILWMDDVKLE